MKVAQYVADRLATLGARQVFMVTGGGAMHLNDALGHHDRLTLTCFHHEQAAAFAAEGYARIAGRPGIVNVTTGPGGINALNGVFAAWTDSVPMIVVSGQVRRETLMASYPGRWMRQLGDQETDIIAMAAPITKSAEMVSDSALIRSAVDRAWHLATSGRPGPTWIDIPVDVQGAEYDPEAQIQASVNPVEMKPATGEQLNAAARNLIERLMMARRPVLMVGSGVRSARALDSCLEIIARLGIPVVTGWTAIDAIPTDHPLFCGRPGDLGTRAGNFVIQNADLLCVMGSRLGIRTTGYNWPAFASRAWKMQIDIDPSELTKPGVEIDCCVEADVGAFLCAVDAVMNESGFDRRRHESWLAWCRARSERYPTVLPKHRENDGRKINPYHFVEILFEELSADAVVACGDGTANVVTFQAAHIKLGQRLFCNAGDASMGYDLPAAIGAAIAAPERPVICLAGDGSVQFNIQELETLRRLGAHLKLFVLNNSGYLSIRLSQRNFFGRLTGADASSGITFPCIQRLAAAYNLPVFLATAASARDVIRAVLAHEGPVVCEVLLDPEQPFEPRLAARRLPTGEIVSPSLEYMSPPLSDAETAENMPDWDRIGDE